MNDGSSRLRASGTFGSQIQIHEPNKLVGHSEVRSRGLTPTARLELAIPIESGNASILAQKYSCPFLSR